MIKRNVYRTNAGHTYDPMEERASLLNQSRKKLNRVSRTLSEEDLGELLGALNSLSDLLKGKQPGDEPEVNDDDRDEDLTQAPDTKANRDIVRGFRANSGDDAAQRVLADKRRRENSAEDRNTRLVRNVARASCSFLDDDDLAAIAGRRR